MTLLLLLHVLGQDVVVPEVLALPAELVFLKDLDVLRLPQDVVLGVVFPDGLLPTLGELDVVPGLLRFRGPVCFGLPDPGPVDVEVSDGAAEGVPVRLAGPEGHVFAHRALDALLQGFVPVGRGAAGEVVMLLSPAGYAGGHARGQDGQRNSDLPTSQRET